MIGNDALTSGSSGGTASITTTDDRDETIDLGHSGASGGNQRVDLGTNKAAIVETSEDIRDAGGPNGVLVGTQDQASAVKEAVSEVSGQIRDQKTETTTDIPKDVTAARNAAAAAGGRGPKDDGLLGAILGFIRSLLDGFGGQ
jgi:ABC-type Na+ efflux pump permease subunit